MRQLTAVLVIQPWRVQTVVVLGHHVGVLRVTSDVDRIRGGIRRRRDAGNVHAIRINQTDATTTGAIVLASWSWPLAQIRSWPTSRDFCHAQNVGDDGDDHSCTSWRCGKQPGCCECGTKSPRVKALVNITLWQHTNCQESVKSGLMTPHNLLVVWRTSTGLELCEVDLFLCGNRFWCILALKSVICWRKFWWLS